MHYFGASAISLDGKNRLNMPARFRDALKAEANNQVTITRSLSGCLMVFPQPEWEKAREKIMALPQEAEEFQRLLLGFAMEVELDGTGRILISPELRKAANIDREVTLLGMGRYMQLWDTVALESRAASALASAQQGNVPPSVKSLVF